ncbi:hypothetical protein NST68_21135 [Paenibacillus sp. FSL E2-0230]|nr:hypothetical protein [Paenibacillus odorifer]
MEHVNDVRTNPEKETDIYSDRAFSVKDYTAVRETTIARLRQAGVLPR